MNTEIKWEEKQQDLGPNVTIGKVGELILFKIYYGVRGIHTNSDPFDLITFLPGIKNRISVKSIDNGKEVAQKCLLRFYELIGN